MIGALARQRYLEAFDDPITVNEADGETVFVEDPEGNAYNLSGLTDEDVLDKIERSHKAGLNLFFIECPPYNPGYSPDADY